MLRAVPPLRRTAIPALVLVLAIAALAGCSDDPSDQQLLNSVMVDSTDVLSDEDSEAVSAIGLELVALGQPLQEWFDDSAPEDQLLARMTAAVDRIEDRLTPERAPEVRSTFEPYVATWRRILAALEAGDMAEYDAAVERIRELDDRRIQRVVDAYGEDVARDLLESEAIDPSR